MNARSAESGPSSCRKPYVNYDKCCTLHSGSQWHLWRQGRINVTEVIYLERGLKHRCREIRFALLKVWIMSMSFDMRTVQCLSTDFHESKFLSWECPPQEAFPMTLLQRRSWALSCGQHLPSPRKAFLHRHACLSQGHAETRQSHSADLLSP